MAFQRSSTARSAALMREAAAICPAAPGRFLCPEHSTSARVAFPTTAAASPDNRADCGYVGTWIARDARCRRSCRQDCVGAATLISLVACRLTQVPKNLRVQGSVNRSGRTNSPAPPPANVDRPPCRFVGGLRKLNRELWLSGWSRSWQRFTCSSWARCRGTGHVARFGDMGGPACPIPTVTAAPRTRFAGAGSSDLSGLRLV